VREAFDAGVTTAFLMAAHEEEKRIHNWRDFAHFAPTKALIEMID
jgi:hypothetical protein